MKRNGRKLNSGIPAKILIGRQGQNVVIKGNHNLNLVQKDEARKTTMNYHQGGLGPNTAKTDYHH